MTFSRDRNLCIFLFVICIIRYINLCDSTSVLDDTTNSNSEDVQKRIHQIVTDQKLLLAKELHKFSLANKTSLDDFTMTTGGTPLRIVLITTWRSGSTFLGDVLNSIPGSFYHYEPLSDLGVVRIRDEPLASKAIRNVRKLLNCDYSDMEEYLKYNKNYNIMFKHNKRLWKKYNSNEDIFWEPQFLNQFCELFPIQISKVLRLRLDVAARLLDDPNLHLVYLVRDPRGTLQSRKTRFWCHNNTDCNEAVPLCTDLESDFETARKLALIFPNRFIAVRFEDLSLDPNQVSMNILELFGVPFHKTVQTFLESHTIVRKGGVYSTFRDSKSKAFDWTQKLKYEETKTIQNGCTKAMSMWGYKQINNQMEQDDNFNPLLTISW